MSEFRNINWATTFAGSNLHGIRVLMNLREAEDGGERQRSVRTSTDSNMPVSSGQSRLSLVRAAVTRFAKPETASPTSLQHVPAPYEGYQPKLVRHAPNRTSMDPETMSRYAKSISGTHYSNQRAPAYCGRSAREYYGLVEDQDAMKRFAPSDTVTPSVTSSQATRSSTTLAHHPNNVLRNSLAVEPIYFGIYNGMDYRVGAIQVDVPKAFSVERNWEQYKAILKADVDKGSGKWEEKEAHSRTGVHGRETNRYVQLFRQMNLESQLRGEPKIKWPFRHRD